MPEKGLVKTLNFQSKCFSRAGSEMIQFRCIFFEP